MTRFINHNGIITPEDAPIFTASNRSFRYGDGLFETIRFYQGKVLWLEEHHSRLTLSMHLLDMELATHLTPLMMLREIRKVCEANGCSNARVRFSVYRQGEGHYAPTGVEAGFVITMAAVEELPYPTGEGLRIGTYTDHVKPFNRLAGLKSAAALLYVLAGQWVSNQGYDEALILNDQGRVAEAVSSNVILVKNGELLTPAYTEACLAGIMKEVVLVEANKMDIDSRTALITLDDLRTADEIWLTNTIKGIQWVREWEGKVFTGKLASTIQQKLQEHSVSEGY